MAALRKLLLKERLSRLVINLIFIPGSSDVWTLWSKPQARKSEQGVIAVQCVCQAQ